MSDAADCLARARTAQALWARRTVAERARAMRPLRLAIAERMDEIVQTISEEVGKPPMDALAGDVMVTLEQLRFYERKAAQVLRPMRRGKPAFLYSSARFVEVQEPHGVVLVCAPWNYPLQLSVVPMATALFAGNAVLLKCSESAPQTAQTIAELCVASGLPEGLVQVSWGGPDEAAALLDARPDFVFFTGSSANGRAVAAKAASLMVPAAMELGGKDAALVFDSCDVERAANGVVYAGFANAGQACVSAKRIYVQRGVYEDFLRALLQRVSHLRVGTTIESDLGSVRLEAVRKRLHEQVADALARGAVLRAGSPDDATPMVLTEVPEDAVLLRDESFGPVVCVTPFETETDAIAMANASEFALSASVWTGDEVQGERAAMQLQCGSCAVNDAIRNIGNPETAFGGNKMSGYGRYHGVEGLRTFSRVKSVMTAGRLKKTEVHWFPFSARTYEQLRGVLQMRHLDGVRRRWKALLGMWMLLILFVCATPARAAESLSIVLARCCKP